MHLDNIIFYRYVVTSFLSYCMSKNIMTALRLQKLCFKESNHDLFFYSYLILFSYCISIVRSFSRNNEDFDGCWIKTIIISEKVLGLVDQYMNILLTVTFIPYSSAYHF